MEETVSKSNKTLREMKQVLRTLEVKIIETITVLKQERTEHRAFLKEISRINGNVDETLGNVLLAIRQNEYLQAYYPAQNGFPELKVVGCHPSKIETRN